MIRSGIKFCGCSHNDSDSSLYIAISGYRVSICMNRIKVINEPSELVSVFRAVDTDLKREIFKDISVEWKTINQIEEKFGKDGRKALRLFEKMKLVETRWQQPSEGTGEKPVKSYHTYYSSFHISTSASVFEISDIIAAEP